MTLCKANVNSGARTEVKEGLERRSKMTKGGHDGHFH